MRNFFLVMVLSLLPFSAVAQQTILIDTSPVGMQKKIRRILLAGRESVIAFRVSSRALPQQLVCRYVSALRQTKASISYSNLPLHIISMARQC